MRWFILPLLILLALLQPGLWFGHGSISEWHRLTSQNAEIREAIQTLTMDNARYAAEVNDLKNGVDAVAERARSDMGMIAPGETFYLLIYDDEWPAPASAEGEPEVLFEPESGQDEGSGRGV